MDSTQEVNALLLSTGRWLFAIVLCCFLLGIVQGLSVVAMSRQIVAMNGKVTSDFVAQSRAASTRIDAGVRSFCDLGQTNLATLGTYWSLTVSNSIHLMRDQNRDAVARLSVVAKQLEASERELQGIRTEARRWRF
jgi:hypothetical protein